MVSRAARLALAFASCTAIFVWNAPQALGASRLSFGRCPARSDAALTGFRCARFRVPLDYQNPHGRQIVLAVVKHLATRPLVRFGTLLMNPGGPGGRGTVQIPDWYLLLPKTVRERFDVISWDPRGVGDSTAVQCFSSQAAEDAFLGQVANFPVRAAQKKVYVATWREFGRLCAVRNGVLLRHVSTADTARDLDRLRRAVGVSRLSYWGLSYGTILGATYANLFPSRVRALVLDGNIAPSAWTARGTLGGPFSVSLRIGSDVGVGMNLRALLSFCGRAAVAACSFSAGSASATTSKFNTLLARLLARPVMVNGMTITYAFILGEIASGGLDSTQPFQDPRLPPTAGSKGWAAIADALQLLWNLTGAGAAPGASRVVATAARGRYPGTEQGTAVVCGDTVNPQSPQRYNALEPFVLHRAGPAGLSLLWTDEICSTWPARSAENYQGPWNRRTANPILVVGNTADPATPYVNSVGIASQLSRARLLTVKGWGHTELLNPSACANRYITLYLLHRTLPPAHTVCQQNRLPFAR